MRYDVHPAVAAVTADLLARSETSRSGYLRRIESARAEGPARDRLR